MDVGELRERGVAIDVPFEAVDGEEIEYADGESFRDKYPELFEPDGEPAP